MADKLDDVIRKEISNIKRKSRNHILQGIGIMIVAGASLVLLLKSTLKKLEQERAVIEVKITEELDVITPEDVRKLTEAMLKKPADSLEYKRLKIFTNPEYGTDTARGKELARMLDRLDNSQQSAASR